MREHGLSLPGAGRRGNASHAVGLADRVRDHHARGRGGHLDAWSGVDLRAHGDGLGGGGDACEVQREALGDAHERDALARGGGELVDHPRLGGCATGGVVERVGDAREVGAERRVSRDGLPDGVPRDGR